MAKHRVSVLKVVIYRHVDSLTLVYFNRHEVDDQLGCLLLSSKVMVMLLVRRVSRVLV